MTTETGIITLSPSRSVMYYLSGTIGANATYSGLQSGDRDNGLIIYSPRFGPSGPINGITFTPNGVPYTANRIPYTVNTITYAVNRIP